MFNYLLNKFTRFKQLMFYNLILCISHYIIQKFRQEAFEQINLDEGRSQGFRSVGRNKNEVGQGCPDLVGSRPSNLGLKTTKGPNSKF